MQTEYRDNPYVAVVAKKCRNLKKKMERILKIESQILAGKPLDEEQKVMYTTKSSVEKSLADLSGIQSALEEVAKDERERGGESSCSLGDRGSEESKGQDACAVEHTKRVAIVETSCSLESKSASEVVEILLKTIYVVQGHRQSSDKAHDDVRLLGQSLLESSVVDAQRTAQSLLENVELLSRIDELYQQLNSPLAAANSTATSTDIATATVSISEPVVSDSVPMSTDAVKESEAQDNNGVSQEKTSRRRSRGKKGANSAAAVPVSVETTEESVPASGASEANATTTITTPEVPLSTVVSSIPLPSPADIVAATADNILVPKRSFEAATAAVLAESVEINFFPIQPTVSPPELVVPTVATQTVPLENNFFLPDQNYLNHIVYPHAPIPAGLPMNSLLAGIPGFGVDYSHGHSPYGLPPVGFEMPSVPNTTGGVEGSSAIEKIAVTEDGKKKRTRNRRGSKDGDRDMSTTPVNSTSGNSNTGVDTIVPNATTPSAPVSAPVAVTSLPASVAAPVPVAAAAPVPAIVPVMGVGAALRYLQGLSPAIPAATVAPAAPAPVMEQAAPAVSASVEGTSAANVEGEANGKRNRRRRGKGENAEGVAPADASAPAVAPALAVAAATPSPVAVAPASVAVPAAAVSVSAGSATETATTEGESEARSRRVRGTRGKGGKGNKTEGTTAGVAANSAGSNTDNSATRSAPVNNTSSAGTAPSKATDGTAKEPRVRAPKPAASTSTTTITNNNASSTATATNTNTTSPRAANQSSSGERRRDGAPRPARESHTNTNANTSTNSNAKPAAATTNTNSSANVNTNRERSPRPSNSAPNTTSTSTAPKNEGDRAPRPPRTTGATTGSNGAINNKNTSSSSGANGTSGRPRPSTGAPATGNKPTNNNGGGAKPSTTTSSSRPAAAK